MLVDKGKFYDFFYFLIFVNVKFEFKLKKNNLLVGNLRYLVVMI